MSFEKPREIAVRALMRREQASVYIEDSLEEEFSKANLSPPDRALLQEIAYGAVRWQRTLDWMIERKTQHRPQKPALAILLRLGLYQIFWLSRIPDHAAVHEMVETAKKLGFNSQAGFINAILRGYVREKEQTRQILEELKATQPSLGFSHPEWLYQRWAKRWGRDKAAALMEWNNHPPDTFARVNTLRADPGKLLEEWRNENVDYDFFRRDWTGENFVFKLRSHPPLAKLKTFQDGWFYIQDPSTVLAVRQLEPRRGESILDLCAAPGGKTTLIAQLMENEGRIVAQDFHAGRLALVTENCQRLGVTCVETARTPESIVPELTTQFDRVLVDSPCSNTGVLKRRVDLRWRIREEEIGRLRDVQNDLLHKASLQLKKGGTLVYSTCSLEPEENSDLIREFIGNHPEFKLENERELAPFIDEVDGAYMARLVRI